jgi:Predicted nucleoside-diphosphate sugar epimerase
LKLLLGEMAEILVGSQRVLPEGAAGFRFTHPVLAGALEDLLA